MKISIFGTGYVGLVTGTCFAEMGNDVICVDVDENKIENLKKGISPIYEPGLDQLVLSNYKLGRLKFTTDQKTAIEASEIIFIAVGTPPGEDGSADLKYVLDVAKSIGQNIKGYKIVVNKSTVPVGTAALVQSAIDKCLRERSFLCDFDVVSNPEFLKEGTAIEDCMKPARVVVGTKSEMAKRQLQALYEPFVRNGHPIIFMDPISSEMTKYAANAMLATKISFMNELSELCEKVNADIELVRSGIGSDPRIGFSFIYPGLGYGGSCFPKDVQALVKTAAQNDVQLGILKSVESANKKQRERFIHKVVAHVKAKSSPQVGIWGLSFKPGTDDVREAPSLDLIKSLVDVGCEIFAYDPVASETTKIALGPYANKVYFYDDQYACLEGRDLLCICTEWHSFREPDFVKMKSLMKSPIIFDGRNLYNRMKMKDLNFQYISIGRQAVN